MSLDRKKIVLFKKRTAEASNPDFPASKDPNDVYYDNQPTSPWTEGDGLAAWSTQGGGTFESSSEDSYIGSKCIKITSPSGSYQGAFVSFGALSAGDEIEFSCWCKTTASSAYFRAFARLTPADETLIVGDGTWRKYTFNLTVTDSTPQIKLYAAKDAGSAGDFVYTDGWQVIKTN